MLTPHQRAEVKRRALEQISQGPRGYFWRLLATHATPEQQAIGKAADEEIKALRAVIRSLGGEV